MPPYRGGRGGSAGAGAGGAHGVLSRGLNATDNRLEEVLGEVSGATLDLATTLGQEADRSATTPCLFHKRVCHRFFGLHCHR